MKCFLFISEVSTLKHVTPVGNDFVDVHVALCTGSCLPDNERKFRIMFPVEDLIAYGTDQVLLFSGQYNEFVICLRSSLFQIVVRIVDFSWTTSFWLDYDCY